MLPTFAFLHGAEPTRFGAGWGWDAQHRFVSGPHQDDSNLLLVIGLGLASEAEDALKVVQELHRVNPKAEALIFPVPTSGHDIEAIVAERASYIALEANGRPVAFVNSSAGATLSAETADVIDEMGVRVLMLFNDAPWVHKDQSLVRTAADALAGSSMERSAGTFFKNGRFFLLGARRALPTSRFCSNLDPRKPFSRLNSKGIPMLLTRGDGDLLVTPRSIKRLLDACPDKSLVRVLRLPTAHQEFSRHGKELSCVSRIFLQACTAMALNDSDSARRSIFDRLEGEILRQAQLDDLKIEPFDTEMNVALGAGRSIADAVGTLAPTGVPTLR